MPTAVTRSVGYRRSLQRCARESAEAGLWSGGLDEHSSQVQRVSCEEEAGVHTAGPRIHRYGCKSVHEYGL